MATADGAMVRTCQFCKEQTYVYHPQGYVLFKYSVRHYAHAICLAKKFGVKGGRERTLEHERKDYDWRLSLLQPNGWDISLARAVDKKAEHAAAHRLLRAKPRPTHAP